MSLLLANLFLYTYTYTIFYTFLNSFSFNYITPTGLIVDLEWEKYDQKKRLY